MLKTEINGFFDDVDEILTNREKYNIEWAFKDAQARLDSFKTDYVEDRFKDKCTLCKHQDIVTEDYTSFKAKSSKLMKRQKYQSHLFANMFTLMTVVEFILSILLVLVISEISHTGEGMVESEILGFWIVTTFAFMKVALERYFLKPRIEAFGWQLYERSFISLKDMAISFNQQLDGDLDTEQPAVEGLHLEVA